MTTDEQHALLIDLAEGTLSAERAAMAAALLEHSADARADLALIRSALTGLTAMPAGDVPSHYFADFLPRLRNRLTLPEQRFRWAIPSFADLLLRPAMAAAAALVLVISYSAFEPQPSASPLYDMFREAALEEVAALLDDPTLLFSATDDAMVEVALSDDAFGVTAEHYQTVSDMNAAMDEQELEQIVDQLEMNGTRKEQL